MERSPEARDTYAVLIRPVAVAWTLQRFARRRKAPVTSVNHAPRNRFGSTLMLRVVVPGASLDHPRTRACSAVTGRESVRVSVIQPEVGPAPSAAPHRGATYAASVVIEADPLVWPPPRVVPVSSASAARRNGPLIGLVVPHAPKRSWPYPLLCGTDATVPPSDSCRSCPA